MLMSAILILLATVYGQQNSENIEQKEKEFLDSTTLRTTNSKSEAKSCLTENNEKGVCITFNLCDDNRSVVVDGKGILEERFGGDCPSYTDTCCKFPKYLQQNDEPPMAVPLILPIPSKTFIPANTIPPKKSIPVNQQKIPVRPALPTPSVPTLPKLSTLIPKPSTKISDMNSKVAIIVLLANVNSGQPIPGIQDLRSLIKDFFSPENHDQSGNTDQKAIVDSSYKYLPPIPPKNEPFTFENQEPKILSVSTNYKPINTGNLPSSTELDLNAIYANKEIVPNSIKKPVAANQGNTANEDANVKGVPLTNNLDKNSLNGMFSGNPPSRIEPAVNKIAQEAPLTPAIAGNSQYYCPCLPLPLLGIPLFNFYPTPTALPDVVSGNNKLEAATEPSAKPNVNEKKDLPVDINKGSSQANCIKDNGEQGICVPYLFCNESGSPGSTSLQGNRSTCTHEIDVCCKLDSTIA